VLLSLEELEEDSSIDDEEDSTVEDSLEEDDSSTDVADDSTSEDSLDEDEDITEEFEDCSDEVLLLLDELGFDEETEVELLSDTLLDEPPRAQDDKLLIANSVVTNNKERFID